MQSRVGIIKRAEKAFTLIEALVVIAIVGIMSSLAIANFRFFALYASMIQLQALVAHAETALEQGIMDLETSNVPPALLGETLLVAWATQSAKGNAEVFDALLPGFNSQAIIPNKHVVLGVVLGPECIYEVVTPDGGATCQWKYIVASDCRYRLAYFRNVREGLEFSYRGLFDDSNYIFGCSNGEVAGF